MEQTAISGRRSWVAIKSVVVWRNIITPRWTKSYFYASFKLLLSPWAVSKAQLPEFSGFSQEPRCETEVKNLFLCPHSFCLALLEKPATLFTANSYNFSHSLDCTTFFTVPSLSLHCPYIPHSFCLIWPCSGLSLRYLDYCSILPLWPRATSLLVIIRPLASIR